MCGALLVACSRPDPESTVGWQPIAADATSAYAFQLESAASARAAMFARLMDELSAAMEDGGPEAAIAVCSERAPAIADEVGATHGVRIGRTSHRLRNPQNASPGWARAAVDDRRESAAYFGHDDGRFGALTPIRIAAPCLLCHGSREQLAPGVPEALTRLYPEDQATGFAEGDLRGWFWVEVPPAEAE